MRIISSKSIYQDEAERVRRAAQREQAAWDEEAEEFLDHPVLRRNAAAESAKPAQQPAAAKPAAAKTTTAARPASAKPAAARTATAARPASAKPAAARTTTAARPASAKPAASKTTAARPASAKPAASKTTASASRPRQGQQTTRTMAQTAAARRAAAQKSAAAAQSTVRETEPRVRAGFVEESPVRPQRRRAAPVKTKRRRKKKKSFGRRVGKMIVTLAVLFAVYLTAVFSNIPFIAKWRTIYIQTAMATMTHQWLATAFIPHSVIDKVMADVAASREAQIGVNSQWADDDDDTSADSDTHRNPTLTDTAGMTEAEIKFFDTFWEVDVDSMVDYVQKNPAALSDGWDHIDINHTSLSDNGTTIRTVQDEQVLAIDADNGVIIVRQSGAGYRGIMAVCKDPSRLSLQAADTIGAYGEVVGEIAQSHNGIIGMTGSGFEDDGGVGNGGTIVGYAMCNGISYGAHMLPGYKRLELRQDNRVYVVDASDEVHPDTTDCVEFSPAMIIDGEIVVDATSGFTDLQPRACIGQSKYGEIIMLLIEGRLPTVSLGLGVPECARIMHRHECAQAMNLDGGTSAMFWYKGDYIMKSSNPVLTAGRPLPNAFVYTKAK